MAPPPIPVDPAIDSWRPSTITLSPGLSLDNLFHPSPRLTDRPNSSGQSNLDTFSEDVQLPAMKQNPTDPNPLVRFWNDPGPWNPQRIGGDPRQAPVPPRFTGFEDPIRRDSHSMLFPTYRSPRSEVGSSTTSRYPVDSGYGGSKSLATPSARSVDHFEPNQSSHSISGDVHNFHLYSEDSYQDTSIANDLSPHGHYPSGDASSDLTHQTTVSFELACSYPNCGAISKNQSEHK